nr:maleylacetoacetate isomerase [uncultured Cupriavidus sp.]
MKPITLLNYFRSSASYRVRIALNLKGLPYDYVAVHLNRDGGEQFQPAFRKRNAQSLVPVYEENDTRISQSIAIIEYLDERFPERPLLPPDLSGRAWVRQISLAIACDIHPLNNLRVLKYLSGTMAQPEDVKLNWIRHWTELGLAALEEEINANGPDGPFCYGDRPTMADCCLVPQLFNAQRFEIDLGAYPRLESIRKACEELPAFQMAYPAAQPDAE